MTSEDPDTAPFAPRRRPKRVTAAEVAEAAGVSRSAVSRAFTPGAYLDKEKQERIMVAALDLGYRPNALAASLHGAHTGLVGVVVGQMTNPYDSEWVAHLVNQLNVSGKFPLLLSGSAETLESAVTAVLRYPLDALIMRAGSISETTIESCTKLNIPMIFSGRLVDHPEVDCVACDNRFGMRTLVDLLVLQGRRSFAYIGGPRNVSSDQEREKGAQAALVDHGLQLVQIVHGDYTFESGAAAMARVLSGAPVDAVICANDAMALGALSYARHQSSRRVPQDVAIVGFDDAAMSALPEFDLTTMRNPADATAEALLQLLEARLADPDKPGETRVIRPLLVARGTH